MCGRGGGEMRGVKLELVGDFSYRFLEDRERVGALVPGDTTCPKKLAGSVLFFKHLSEHQVETSVRFQFVYLSV